MTLLLFFFPCTRRHSTFSRHWSSDVCSSDLTEKPRLQNPALFAVLTLNGSEKTVLVALIAIPWSTQPQIGRASCRERSQYALLCIFLIRHYQRILRRKSYVGLLTPDPDDRPC